MLFNTYSFVHLQWWLINTLFDTLLAIHYEVNQNE
jgi:hypothetical protein